MKKTLHLFALSCLVISFGCFQNSEESTPPEPEVFEITATDIVVEEEALPEVPKTKIVRADFNMDMLEDLALAEEDADGKSSINIYIQKKTDGLKKSFYKAGSIRDRGDYKISALMTHKAESHIDLLVMFNYMDGAKHLVYFRSDGKSFKEVQREVREEAATEEEQ